MLSLNGGFDTDRCRAFLCVEVCVYCTLVFVVFPLFPASFEFIVACIFYFVHPVNTQMYCLTMQGADSTEQIINGIGLPVKPSSALVPPVGVRG